MGRPTAAVLALGTAMTLMTACGPDGCTEIAGARTITIQVPRPIQKVAHTLRVELCQADRCDSFDITTRAGDETDGVSRDADGNYDIDLGLFDNSVKAGTETRLSILGFSRTNRMVLRHTERFTFDDYYPNGKDCDDQPSLRHATSIGGEDLIG